MLTFAVPEPAVELPAADDAEADAVADEPDDFLSSLEQPVRPAARTAAPATATTKPRFITCAPNLCEPSGRRVIQCIMGSANRPFTKFTENPCNRPDLFVSA